MRLDSNTQHNKKARKDFINKQSKNKNRQKISPKRRYKMLVNFKKHVYRDETQEQEISLKKSCNIIKYYKG